MKKVIVAALLVVGLTTYAQEKEGRRSGKEKLTSEQKVNLQVKKMTKDLDLNEKQTKDVRALVAKQVEKREAIKIQMQAEKEAVSVEMKKILTAEQYAKWEKNRDEKIENFKEKMSERKEKRKSQALPKSN
jgi:Spy/CpxP family protein refolding chaperone